MRLLFIALLVFIALVAITEVSSTKVTTFKVVRLASDKTTGNDVRLLITKTENASEEERAISTSAISNWLTRVKTWLQSKWAAIKGLWANRKQIQQWKKEKSTPDNAFEALKLNAGTETLLSNPKLNVWSKYLKIYNKKNPTQMRTMIGTFTKYYGDEAVAKMLEVGRRNPATNKLANSLQGQKLLGWRLNGLSQDNVFQLLKLDDGGLDAFFTNPNAYVWYYYFFQGNVHNKHAYTTLIQTLTTRYEDEAVAKTIEMAKKVESPQILPDKVMSPHTFATRFETAQFKQWMLEGIDPAAVLTKLIAKLDAADADDIYKSYAAFYKKHNT